MFHWLKLSCCIITIIILSGLNNDYKRNVMEFIQLEVDLGILNSFGTAGKYKGFLSISSLSKLSSLSTLC